MINIKTEVKKFSDEVCKLESKNKYNTLNYIGFVLDSDCTTSELFGSFRASDLYQMREGSADNYWREMHARIDLHHEDTWALMAALAVKKFEKEKFFPHDIFLKALDVAEELLNTRID